MIQKSNPRVRLLLSKAFRVLKRGSKMRAGVTKPVVPGICLLVHCFLLASVFSVGDADEGGRYFEIRIVDENTGRGVPLVELETVNNVRYVTDSSGIIAFCEPGLMDQKVFFHVKSHGYEFPKDGFGYRGKRLHVEPGKRVTLRIRRLNIAERLYRITGAGIYRDSLLTGATVPINRPVLNGQVFGSDSVVNAIYRGKIYWFWGDTNRPSYPLGNFHVPGAVSDPPSAGGLGADRGINLRYFLDEKGFAKPVAKMPGSGPTWINGLTVLADDQGRQRMYCAYVKIKPPLTVYQRGLAVFDDLNERFVKVAEFDLSAPLFPGGHPIRFRDDKVDYIYYGDPFPLTRVPADPKAIQDLTQYEAFTCLKKGSRLESLEVDRDKNGVVFGWKSDTVPYTPKLQERLLKEGLLDTDEGLFQLRDPNGKNILIHGGSVAWNDYRRKWIMIAVQSFGTSFLGEVWFAEADDVTGPWENARKIVSHDNYSFYNPKQHPMFADGRYLYFEGTYTTSFSGNTEATPRYDYNQIMYRLDLNDQRLNRVTD